MASRATRYRARQIQIVSNRFLKSQQQHCDKDAACPGALVEASIPSVLSLSRALLGHNLGGNDLKRQRHRGDQSEQSVDGSSMPETLRVREIARPQCYRQSWLPSPALSPTATRSSPKDAGWQCLRLLG